MRILHPAFNRVDVRDVTTLSVDAQEQYTLYHSAYTRTHITCRVINNNQSRVACGKQPAAPIPNRGAAEIMELCRCLLWPLAFGRQPSALPHDVGNLNAKYAQLQNGEFPASSHIQRQKHAPVYLYGRTVINPYVCMCACVYMRP